MTQSFDDLKEELLSDPAVRAEYDARAEEFEITSELIAARLRAGCHKSNSLVEWAFRNRPSPASNPGDTGRAGQRCKRYAKATGAPGGAAGAVRDEVTAIAH